ncbi:MAG: SOS response-associated peptidase [Bacteroidia bacterium]
MRIKVFNISHSFTYNQVLTKEFNMCGRYTLAGKMVDLEKHYKAKVLGKAPEISFNIAPSQHAPVILNIQPNIIRTETWGLVPFWIKPGDKPLKLINSRSDTILSKPSFKKYLERKRCLVPASGFYEWKSQGKIKQPYYMSLKSEKLFSFAGIWEEYANEDGELIYTYSILTTEPNSLMSEIHNRMPVILREEDEQKWLQDSDISRLSTLMVPYESSSMQAWLVSTKVNSANSNDSSLIEELPPSNLF